MKIKGKNIKLNINDTKKVIFLSFFLPVIIFLISHFIIGMFPFGKRSILSLDLNAQYIHYYIALKNAIFGEGGIIYSWDRTLGGEFLGIIAYYLASPFGIIMIIFAGLSPGVAAGLTILLKIGAAGATMSFFLQKSEGVSSKNTIVFSIMYALNAYNVAYGSNIMWLDAVIILPILAYGIKDLIKNKNFKLYTIALTYAMFTNYYMGYMLCIFTVLYFFYAYFGYNENNRNNAMAEKFHFAKTSLRFGALSALSMCISAVMLLPAYRSLSFGKTEFHLTDFTPNITAPFLEITAKLFPGTYDSVSYGGRPFIYCGILALILTPLYFLHKNISAREKIASGVLLAVLGASFSITTINLVWHGFQPPNWLDYRYSFIFCFFLCSLSAQAMQKREEISKKSVVAVCAFIVLVLFQIQLAEFEFVDLFKTLIFSLVLLMIYLCVICIPEKEKTVKYFTPLLCVIVCLELFVSSFLTIYSYDDEVHYAASGVLAAHLKKYSSSIETVKQNEKGFYRSELYGKRRINDSFSLGLRGLTTSTSTFNESVISLMKYMGYNSRSHNTYYTTPNPVSDSLLGIKYLFAEKELVNGVMTKTDLGSGDITVYLNPYALSLAYCVQSDFSDFDASAYKNPFETLNAMLSKMTGEDIQVYKPVMISSRNLNNLFISYADNETFFIPRDGLDPEVLKSIDYTLNFDSPSLLYSYFPTDYPNEVEIFVNDDSIGKYYGGNTDTIQFLGELEDNVTVSLVWQDEDFRLIKTGVNCFYTFDSEAMERAFSVLSENEIKITEFKSTKITGNITAKSDRILFTSIPYDDDWSVYIDGEKTEIFKTCDSLLAVDISEGEHLVIFNFSSRSFKTGLAVTLLSLSAFIAVWYLDKKNIIKFP